MRADNQIDAAGAASLGPSLGRMTQLTSLDLNSTLLDIGGSWGCSRVLANAGNALMMLRAVGWGGCAQGCSGWGLARGEPRGGGACRQSDQSRLGSVAGTETLEDDATDVAGSQQYAACHRRQLGL